MSFFRNKFFMVLLFCGALCCAPYAQAGFFSWSVNFLKSAVGRSKCFFHKHNRTLLLGGAGCVAVAAVYYAVKKGWGLSFKKGEEKSKKPDNTMPEIEQEVSEDKISDKNINELGKDDQTPLMRVVAKGDMAGIEKLLSSPSLVINKKNGSGFTALHLVGKKNRAKVITLLLNHGADPNVVSSIRKWTPLAKFVNKKHFAVDAFNALINNAKTKQDIFFKQDDETVAPLDYCFSDPVTLQKEGLSLFDNKNLNLSVLFVGDKKFFINYISKQKKDSDLLKAVLKHKNFDINTVFKFFWGCTTGGKPCCFVQTLLSRAFSQDNNDLAKILLDYGADPNVYIQYKHLDKPMKETVLHQVARLKNRKATDLLMKYSSNKLLKDQDDKTAVDLYPEVFSFPDLFSTVKESWKKKLDEKMSEIEKGVFENKISDKKNKKESESLDLYNTTLCRYCRALDLESLKKDLFTLEEAKVVCISLDTWKFVFNFCTKDKFISEDLATYFVKMIKKFPDFFSTVKESWEQKIFAWVQKHNNFTLLQLLGSSWEVKYFFKNAKKDLTCFSNFSLDAFKKISEKVLSLEDLPLFERFLKLYDKTDNASIKAYCLNALSALKEKYKKEAIKIALKNDDLVRRLPEINVGKIKKGPFWYDFSSGKKLYQYNKICLNAYLNEIYKKEFSDYKQSLEKERIKKIKSLFDSNVKYFCLHSVIINKLNAYKLADYSDELLYLASKRNSFTDLVPIDDMYTRICAKEAESFADYSIGKYCARIGMLDQLLDKVKNLGQ